MSTGHTTSESLADAPSSPCKTCKGKGRLKTSATTSCRCRRCGGTGDEPAVVCVWCDTPRRDWEAAACNAPDGDGHLAFKTDEQQLTGDRT
jgi:RecJ-like exonuclease